MHKREIRGNQVKYVCPECGAAFDFRTGIEKHQDSALKRCPGKGPGRAYTAL